MTPARMARASQARRPRPSRSSRGGRGPAARATECLQGSLGVFPSDLHVSQTSRDLHCSYSGSNAARGLLVCGHPQMMMGAGTKPERLLVRNQELRPYSLTGSAPREGASDHTLNPIAGKCGAGHARRDVPAVIRDPRQNTDNFGRATRPP